MVRGQIALHPELALQNRINSESEEKKHIMDMELKDAQAEKSRAEKEKADVTHKLHMMEEKGGTHRED
ncbi:MAG: hypothetical protein KVP17_002416 [Porospora cf. gigantea B]|uniref:uncharacterized protein n=1 Tax=Porospora cf. gigantea B TaxID=2853592 RepID=UPI003571DC46|nr:MAG: hypothetical protein KVP17_002416 [Porospora cf. gigantea B]